MAAINHNAGLGELQGYARWLGRLFTVIAAMMTFSFGYSLGGDDRIACWLIGVGLAAVTVLVSILLNFVDIAWRSDNRQIAYGLMAVWAVCVGVEYFSHIGFTVGHRTSDVQKASIQTTVYEDTRGGLDEAKSRVAFFEKRLLDLKGGEGWSSSRPVAAWQADITNMEGDHLYKRSKQCANVTQPDSRAFCDRLKELRANLATAEEHAKTTAMLAAARTGLDKARASAVEVKKGDSAVYSQTAMVAQIATGSLAPTATALQWAGIGIGAFISLVFSFAGTVCNFLALRDWGGPGNRTLPQAHALPRTLAVTPAPAPTRVQIIEERAKPEQSVIERVRELRSKVLVTGTGRAVELRP